MRISLYRSTLHITALIAVLILSVGVASAATPLPMSKMSRRYQELHPSSVPTVQTAQSIQAAPPAVSSRGFLPDEQALITTVQEANPSVVSVIISKDVPVYKKTYQSVPFDQGFGGGFSIDIPQYVQQGTKSQQIGGGTAFFVTATGLLMTNNHVISDKNAQYTVLMNDGSTHTARVVVSDEKDDVALLQVDVQGVHPLPLAQSDDLYLAQTAIAIGNALGEFSNTVSVGVVSGLQRSITADTINGGSETLTQIIQTDAAINPGNSGGPLLSSKGEVIGMNTAVSSTGQNIGFAIPAKTLRTVLQQYQAGR